MIWWQILILAFVAAFWASCCAIFATPSIERQRRRFQKWRARRKVANGQA